MAEKRIYKVVTTDEYKPGDGSIYVRLVEASTPAQAIRHVVRTMLECEVCGVSDAVQLGAQGITVEKAAEA